MQHRGDQTLAHLLKRLNPRYRSNGVLHIPYPFVRDLWIAVAFCLRHGTWTRNQLESMQAWLPRCHAATLTDLLAAIEGHREECTHGWVSNTIIQTLLGMPDILTRQQSTTLSPIVRNQVVAWLMPLEVDRLRALSEPNIREATLMGPSPGYSFPPPDCASEDFDQAFRSIHANSLPIHDQHGRVLHPDNCR